MEFENEFNDDNELVMEANDKKSSKGRPETQEGFLTKEEADDIFGRHTKRGLNLREGVKGARTAGPTNEMSEFERHSYIEKLTAEMQQDRLANKLNNLVRNSPRPTNMKPFTNPRIINPNSVYLPGTPDPFMFRGSNKMLRQKDEETVEDAIPPLNKEKYMNTLSNYMHNKYKSPIDQLYENKFTEMEIKAQRGMPAAREFAEKYLRKTEEIGNKIGEFARDILIPKINPPVGNIDKLREDYKKKK